MLQPPQVHPRLAGVVALPRQIRDQLLRQDEEQGLALHTVHVVARVGVDALQALEILVVQALHECGEGAHHNRRRARCKRGGVSLGCHLCL